MVTLLSDPVTKGNASIGVWGTASAARTVADCCLAVGAKVVPEHTLSEVEPITMARPCAVFVVLLVEGVVVVEDVE